MEVKKNKMPFILLDSQEAIVYSEDVVRMVLAINKANKMNRTQLSQIVSELNQERKSDLQLIDSLKKVGTPSAAKMIQEIEQKSRLIESIVKPATEFMALQGIPIKESQTNAGAIPKSMRDKHLKDIILSMEAEEPFDISIIRDLAFSTHPGLFGTPAEFYGIYWRIIKELESDSLIRVTVQGGGRRPTIFVKNSAVTAKK